MDIVGERWAMLVVRDLVLGPKRFTDLRHGLPKIPTNILSTRLKELEQAGVIARRVLPRPAASVVYELTDYGRELEDVLMRLGAWGARSLAEPKEDEIVTTDSMIMALRSTFQPDAARDVTVGYEFHFGDVVIHARIDDGELITGDGGLDGADLVVHTGPAFKALIAGELTPEQALTDGAVALQGDPALLDTLVGLFRIGARPASVPV